MPRGDLRVSFGPPIKGLKTDIPPHLVEDGHMTAGTNIVVRDNSVRVRPGSITFGVSTGISDAIMGAITYKTNAEALRLFVCSLTKVYEYDGSTFTNRTGTDLTGTTDTPVRLALFQTNTASTVVGTNNTDAPFKLVAGSNKAALGGGPPSKAKDVTVCFGRVIFGNVVIGGVRGPSTLMISDVNNPESFPALNIVDLTDSNDTIVAVKALNTQAFAIYKDNSQWIGVGAPNIYPFNFDMRSQAPGPLSPGVVVAAYGVHYYLGQDGNVYTFDGDQTKPIGNNVHRSLQADINFGKAIRAHGFFDRTNRDIWWFYNSISYNSSSSHPDSGICYNLTTGAFSTICRFPTQYSTSTEWKVATTVTWNSLTQTWDTIGASYNSWDSFPVESQLVGAVFSNIGAAFAFGNAATDNGTAIDGDFTMPLRDFAGPGQKVRVDAIEPYWKQAIAARTLTVTLLTSSTMATSGTAQTAQTFDINVDTRHVATYSGQETRFAGVKQAITAGHSDDEFRGVTWYIYKRSEI